MLFPQNRKNVYPDETKYRSHGEIPAHFPPAKLVYIQFFLSEFPPISFTRAVANKNSLEMLRVFLDIFSVVFVQAVEDLLPGYSHILGLNFYISMVYKLFSDGACISTALCLLTGSDLRKCVSSNSYYQRATVCPHPPTITKPAILL